MTFASATVFFLKFHVCDVEDFELVVVVLVLNFCSLLLIDVFDLLIHSDCGFYCVILQLLDPGCLSDDLVFCGCKLDLCLLDVLRDLLVIIKDLVYNNSSVFQTHPLEIFNVQVFPLALVQRLSHYRSSSRLPYVL
jgi:hypothetical protein